MNTDLDNELFTINDRVINALLTVSVIGAVTSYAIIMWV